MAGWGLWVGGVTTRRGRVGGGSAARRAVPRMPEYQKGCIK